MPAVISAPDDPDVSPNRVPADPVVRKLRATTAAHTRHGNRELADKSRRQLDMHQLGEHIKRVVDSAPPLSPAQREALAVLLVPEAAVSARATA